ncbi:MAG: pilus assembly protein CpaC [Devosia sp.]|nr:pilus assembly protein CpaC [Devosia sp.]
MRTAEFHTVTGLSLAKSGGAPAGRTSSRFGRAACVALALALVTLAPARPALAQTVNYDIATTSVMRINLPVSQAVTVTVSGVLGKAVAADAAIADAQLITSRSLYLIGKSFGTTTVNLFSETGEPIGLLAVEVGADTDDMTSAIRSAVPHSDVRVSTVNGRVRLSGTVSDEGSMQKVLQIVDQYGSPGVINTITLAGGQQVNLEVRILEAQRDAGRQLGVQWGGSVGGVSANIGGGPSNPAGGAASFSSFATSVLSGLTGVSLTATINALEAKSLVRTLAEPNLTTLSGVKASFLAGGQVPIRVSDGKGGATIEYRDFGVRLVFTPVVLDGDRIQIQLTPEVSSIGAMTAAGDPVFSTRTLDATVELRDGQSFSVAGLLQANSNTSQNQLPLIGDIPVLGALFRSSSYQKNDTELVVIVTPRLVQPATPGQVLATPLDGTAPANDAEFFLLGQMEVTPKMIKNFEAGAGVIGPFGYMIDLGLGETN